MRNVMREIKVLTKKEIERARKKWVLRVFLTFIVVVIILIGVEKTIKFYGLSETYLKVSFVVLAIVYLFQIFSYRKIKCTNCGNSIFNQYSIFFSTPKECKRCKTMIE